MNELMITGSILAGGIYMGTVSKDKINKTGGYAIAAIAGYTIWSRWTGKFGKQWFMNKRDGII